MEMVDLLLKFIRATRQSLWTVHLTALEYILPLYLQNYARLTPVYISQMYTLKKDDPVTWDFLENGYFTVNKSDVPFCRIGGDHAIEHENRAIKVSGGIIGFVNNEEALQRYFMIAPEMSVLLDDFYTMSNIEQSDYHRREHHRFTCSTNERIDKNVVKLLWYL